MVNVIAAFAANDFDAMQRIGHNCKGIGKGYGFPQISAAGAAMETAARSRQIAALDMAVRQFAAVVESVIFAGAGR